MNDLSLGKLERVEVREAWGHEARDFTPWLADNLDLLADELGVELELEATEVQVGPYRADIVARNRFDDSVVLIENQLETANLQHLGQILAYMAGIDAHIVVWIATGFNQAHRSAIRWLNEHTVDPFAFFAVEVRTVRIGDSRLAPVFDVVERPNEWERTLQAARSRGGVSELGKFRREFWLHFADRIPEAPGLRPGHAGSNVWIPVEGAGLRIVQFLAHDRVGMYVVGKQGELSTDVAPRIDPFVAPIKNALDDNDTFYERVPDYRCAIERRGDTNDRTNWDSMVDWLDDRRRRYEKILSAAPDSPPATTASATTGA